MGRIFLQMPYGMHKQYACFMVLGICLFINFSDTGSIGMGFFCKRAYPCPTLLHYIHLIYFSNNLHNLLEFQGGIFANIFLSVSDLNLWLSPINLLNGVWKFKSWNTNMWKLYKTNYFWTPTFQKMEISYGLKRIIT